VILEQAVLQVKTGQGAAFEAAMDMAKNFIATAPGFRKMEVRPCIETQNRYLLLVWWDTLEAHTEGFRRSSEYEKWRATLHHFYEPFPVVEHYGAPLVAVG
jgi:heme-degrading monooxygenase HmoA